MRVKGAPLGALVARRAAPEEWPVLVLGQVERVVPPVERQARRVLEGLGARAVPAVAVGEWVR